MPSPSVGDGLVHGPLGAGELGGGDNLHGLGDLLDVADGLETALDLTESGIVGGLSDERGGDGRRAVGGRSVGGCLKEWLRCARCHASSAARSVWEAGHTAWRQRQP